MKRKLSLSAARPPTSRKAREVGHPELVYSTIQSESRYHRAGEVGHPPAGESESFVKLLQRTYGTRVVQPRDANQGRVSFPGRLFRFVMMTLTVQGSRQKRLSQ